MKTGAVASGSSDPKTLTQVQTGCNLRWANATSARLQLLGPVELARGAVEGAQRKVPRLSGDREQEAVEEAERGRNAVRAGATTSESCTVSSL